jgi:formate dehydrogenase subunit gamma
VTSTTAPPRATLPRFTRTETLVHRATAVVVAVLFLTGAALYYEPLVLLVSRRPLVEGMHIAAGLVLPVPMLVGLIGSPALRHDLRVLGRLTAIDREWLRRRDRRRAELPVGKFNGGQKLAASVMAGSGVVLFLTGLLLIAPVRLDLPVRIREGATIVHDLFTFGVLVLLLGHLWLAYRHPEARVALRTGQVDRGYAEREHSGWARTLQDTSDRPTA